MLGGQLVVVDAVHDGQVDALRGGGDQHALGAGGQMLRRAVAIGEESRAVERDVAAQLGVRQVGGVAFGGDANALAIAYHRVAIGLHFPRARALDAVALRSEQRRVGKEGVRTVRTRWSRYPYT